MCQWRGHICWGEACGKAGEWTGMISILLKMGPGSTKALGALGHAQHSWGSAEKSGWRSRVSRGESPGQQLRDEPGPGLRDLRSGERKEKESEVTQWCPTLCDPRTVAYQAPPSMGFSRQECWSGLPFPSPGDLPDPGIEPGSPALRADALPWEVRGGALMFAHRLGMWLGSFEQTSLWEDHSRWVILSGENLNTPFSPVERWVDWTGVGESLVNLGQILSGQLLTTHWKTYWWVSEREELSLNPGFWF